MRSGEDVKPSADPVTVLRQRWSAQHESLRGGFRTNLMRECQRHNSSGIKKVAERTGLEPATPGVTGRYSNRLNYRSAFYWWVLRGSNPRPSPCKGDALPAELSTRRSLGRALV